METIKLSIMQHYPETIGILKSMLKDFEEQQRVQVEIIEYDWGTAREELTRIALYQQGVEVSEIGSTWLADMVAMNALRPFNSTEIAQFIQKKDFNSCTWSTVKVAGDENVYAAPWYGETIILFYRTDLLEKVGLNPDEAFASHQAIDETAARLSAAGVAIPVLLPMMSDSFSVLHTLASWVWTAGGDFCTPDGRTMLFDQPVARAGIRDFFKLLRHVAPETRAKLMQPNAGSLFWDGQAAITFGAHLPYMPQEGMAPEVAGKWACREIPGQHFAGGSHLVIWKHVRRERNALNLIRYLTQTQNQNQCAVAIRALPARLSALSEPELLNDPVQKVMITSLSHGRSYHPVRLWAMIEERITEAVIAVEQAYLENMDVDLDELIDATVSPVARRLNMSLST